MMNLQRTGGKEGVPLQQNNVQKNAAKPVAQSSVQNSAQKSLSADTSAVIRSISSIITTAGLPVDKLSASIVSFARFFSLPLKPETLATIRRQAFTQVLKPVLPAAVTSAADNAGGQKAAQEAAARMQTSFSLAATAAESKGVELSPRGLEAFVKAVDPDQHGRDQQSPNGEGAPADRQAGQNQSKHSDGRQGQSTPQKESSFAEMSAGKLKQLALEAMENNPLLTVLNRLPGKNGQRWIVLPFDFNENGRRFRVSLRILLETASITNTVSQKMVLDITESGDFERRWLFALEGADRLSVYLSPELLHKKHASFARELSKLTGISVERITIKSWQEPFPFELGDGEELCAINEAV